ncbi:MAG TPA: SRPBCC family protein [Armatimonadota bacterium]|jgi:ribosome-associated toxin RatA of RatAB toxin-antitoxin module
MVTTDEIVMQAPPDAIFRAASEVERWPHLLPHYRWVKVLERDGDACLVEMAARRGPFPVKWTSLKTQDAEALTVHYRHVGGPTRGMRVVWLIEPGPDGTLVSIVHDFRLEIPVLRSLPGQLIIGHCFVKPIANRTLQHLKAHVEASSCAEPSLPE